MPVTVQIVPRYALVLITYGGVVGLQETLTALQRCAASSEFRPWFPHLLDLRRVIDYERNMAGFIEMQAKAIDILPLIGSAGVEFRMILLAPDGAGRGMAELIRRTWEGLGQARVLIAEDEAGAMDLLGLPRMPIAQLTDSGFGGAVRP
ncbi:MAG: hypothetical protein ACXIU7_11225 [Roseinatronobacter sp.]